VNLPACDICRRNDVELVRYTLSVGEERRAGEVCDEHRKKFTRLLEELPQEPNPKRYRRFEDSVVASPDDIPRTKPDQVSAGGPSSGGGGRKGG
jgi:hypothetical protein